MTTPTTPPRKLYVLAIHDDEFERFHTELTANRVGDAGTLRYSAGLPAALRGRRLQVITQTVTGRVGSMTVSLEDVR